jgi:hypothetical protein
MIGRNGAKFGRWSGRPERDRGMDTIAAPASAALIAASAISAA